MPTTKADLQRWLQAAPEGTTHMIVATDTYDYSDYPVYVPDSSYRDSDGNVEVDPAKVRDLILAKDMTKVMECYDLGLPLEAQLAEHRAQHWEMRGPAPEPGPYGVAPVDLGEFPVAWHEYLRYLYLPVVIPDHDLLSPVQVSLNPRIGVMPSPIDIVLPERLRFAEPMVEAAIDDYLAGHHGWPVTRWSDLYVYVSAHRGYATPGNPLNRPGWHTDGFGSDDLNYVWFDAVPTWMAVQPFVGIDPDHVASLDQMTAQIDHDRVIKDLPCQHLYRLTPHVVHAAPEIPAPGLTRSFLKISISAHRYNLLGNSHNYQIAYQWQMHDRAELRNDPYRGETDYIIEGT